MTKQEFSKWLDGLKSAWETKNPTMAANLCSENVRYYEDPFGKPLNKKQVLREWKNVPKSQKDIRFSYKILGIINNLGIAQWSAKFTRVPSEENAHLEGIFTIELNNYNLCTEFHQWWNSRKKG